MSENQQQNIMGRNERTQEYEMKEAKRTCEKIINIIDEYMYSQRS